MTEKLLKEVFTSLNLQLGLQGKAIEALTNAIKTMNDSLNILIEMHGVKH